MNNSIRAIESIETIDRSLGLSKGSDDEIDGALAMLFVKLMSEALQSRRSFSHLKAAWIVIGAKVLVYFWLGKPSQPWKVKQLSVLLRPTIDNPECPHLHY